MSKEDCSMFNDFLILGSWAFNLKTYISDSWFESRGICLTIWPMLSNMNILLFNPEIIQLIMDKVVIISLYC